MSKVTALIGKYADNRIQIRNAHGRLITQAHPPDIPYMETTARPTRRARVPFFAWPTT
jgi:hypothetical protein